MSIRMEPGRRLRTDLKKLKGLLLEYEDIRLHLEKEATGDGRFVLYADLSALIVKIANGIFCGQTTVKKGKINTKRQKRHFTVSFFIEKVTLQKMYQEARQQGGISSEMVVCLFIFEIVNMFLILAVILMIHCNDSCQRTCCCRCISWKK